MWGCNYLAFSGSGWDVFFPGSGSIWSLMILGLVILLVVYLSIKFFKPQAHNFFGTSQDRIDSLAILKARFAKGEISREEFVKMKQILSQH